MHVTKAPCRNPYFLLPRFPLDSKLLPIKAGQFRLKKHIGGTVLAKLQMDILYVSPIRFVTCIKSRLKMDDLFVHR